MQNTKLFYLIIAHIPTLYFDSLAWIILMKNKLSTKTAFIITWISQTSGKFIPSGNITGAFVRFYLARRSGQKFGEASSTVFNGFIYCNFFIISNWFSCSFNFYCFFSQIKFNSQSISIFNFGVLFNFLRHFIFFSPYNKKKSNF